MVWEQVKAIDHHLSVPLHNCASIGPCEYVVFLLAVAFNPCVLPFLWAAALMPYPISPQLIFACSSSILLTLVLTLFLKKALGRPRPVYNSTRGSQLLLNFRERETNCSMPSGDSAQAGLFWAFLVLQTGLSLPLGCLCAFGTMFARVFYMCHYWGDTVAGVGLGVMVAWLTSDLVPNL